MIEGDQIICKVVLVGESGVGKTCISQRFIEDIYEDNVVPTASASCTSKVLEFVKYGGIRSAVCPLCMICRGMLLFYFSRGQYCFCTALHYGRKPGCTYAYTL